MNHTAVMNARVTNQEVRCRAGQPVEWLTRRSCLQVGWPPGVRVRHLHHARLDHAQRRVAHATAGQLPGAAQGAAGGPQAPPVQPPCYPLPAPPAAFPAHRRLSLLLHTPLLTSPHPLTFALSPIPTATPPLRLAHPLAALIAVTALSGAFVAGNDAGR